MRYKPQLKSRKEVITLERIVDNIFEAKMQITTPNYETRAYDSALILVERRYHELTGRYYDLRGAR